MSAAEPSLYVTSVPCSDARSSKPVRSGGVVSRMSFQRASPSARNVFAVAVSAYTRIWESPFS
ncbi:hypothetical protein ACWC9U_11650 [Streptomyces sp. 900116325]